MSNKKILIIDDDPDVTLGMHLRFRAHQYDTFFAADVPSSLEEARKYAPDLIVLDLGLPAGDGYMVMEELQKAPALANIPVIVVSARDLEGNRARSLKAGARAFLQKPVDNAVLMAVIRRELGQSI